MSKFKFAFLGLGLFIVGGGAFFVYRLSQPVGSEGKVEITINPGESVRQIGEKLDQANLIDSTTFVFYVLLKDLTRKIQAGIYEIPRTLTPVQIVELLQHGTFDIRLTFLEGWRREEYLEYALSKLAVDDEAFTAEFLKETAGLEGYLFPDTYAVPINTTAKELVGRLHANFEARYAADVEALEKGSGLSRSQIVNIAAMLERETSNDTAEEMQTIAGIIIKRWKSPLWSTRLLQVDATVQYALGRQWNAEKGRWEWWKDKLTAADLRVDSPYNTYRHRGLPPGPIANPGLAALLATVQYKKDPPYWYYLHCSDGQVRYARTLEEQVRNQACIR